MDLQGPDSRDDCPRIPQGQGTSPSGSLSLGAVLGLLGTACLILALPPHNVWPLIFVAFAPMALADYRLLRPRWAGLGSALGWGGWPLVYVTMVFGFRATTWFMQGIAVPVGVVNLAGGRGLRRFHEHSEYRWFVLLGMASTVGIEMARSFIPFIATQAFAGHTLHSQPWLLQPVSLFGIHGLDAWITLVGYELGLTAIALFHRKWRWEETPAGDRRWNAR